MKKRLLFLIVSFVIVFTLGSCNLEQKQVELGASVSFQHEMVEKTQQKVTVELTDKSLDTIDLEVSYNHLNPEVAEITSEGIIHAHKPGEAKFEVELVLGEAKKEFEFSVKVLAIEYYITYELNGGQNSELNPEGFAESELPLALQPATKAGYEFAGWLYEGEKVETIPAGTTKNVTLVATWEVVEYAIAYDLAGGAHKGEAPAKYTVEEEVVLGEAEKAGYEFLGWYAGEEKVEKVEVGSTGDLELVAKWEVVEYNVSVVLDGGELASEAPAKYTVEDEIELPVPTKANYRFVGWYVGDQKVEKIAKGTTGDLEIVAKWEFAEYSISYDAQGGELDVKLYSYDDIVAEFLADFNKYGNVSLTATNFASGSSSAIKVAFANAEMLAKWAWFFEFALADLKAAYPDATSAYLLDAYPALEEFLKGEYKVITGDATVGGPNARTMIRNYIGGMLQKQKGDASNTTFQAYTTDFADAARQEALVAAANAGSANFFKFTPESEFELPKASKAGYEFLGWYDGETKVEKIEKGTYGDIALVARWEVIEYTISYDAQGGDLGVKLYTYDDIAAEFLADFNKYGNVSLTATNFASGSSSAIKVAFANAEMLAKWAWFFEFALADLKAAYPDATSAYLLDAYPALEEFLKGEYKVITGDATVGGPNARTMIRNYIGGMLQKQKGDASNTTFQAFTTDFADAARQEALVAAANAGNQSLFKYTIESEFELPVPTKADHTFLGWYAGEEKVEKITKGSTGNLELVAKWEANSKVESEVEFVLDGGAFAEGEEVPTKYVEGEGLATLPKAAKEGYKFLGWYLGEEKVEAISAEQTGKVVLTAKWEEIPEQPEIPSEGRILEVGEGKEYPTLGKALEAAQAGDTIRIPAGTYTELELSVPGLTLEGPNAGVSAVNGTRAEEAVFEGDIVLAANNITLDGIKLVGAARVVGAESGVANISIKNVLVTGSTVNQGNISVNAPFFFAPAAGSEMTNIEIVACKAVDYDSDRPMYFYGYDINGLVIKDCYFVGNRKNYNDGLKIDSDLSTYGIKGDVLFEGNHVEGFSQYVVWFRVYAEGTYKVINNTFINNGQTAGSHAAASFITYKGAADGKVSIEFTYNTVRDSYMLVRIDAACPANASVKVNYNKSINNNGSYYIKNASSAKVDALLNYYGETPSASKFMGVEAYNPYYNTEAEVPAYGSASETVFSPITYEANGGEVSGESQYLEGVEFTLPTPTREGYVFLGWTLEAESENYITALSAEQKGAVTVYAQWKLERLSEVTYDFNGGVSEALYLANGNPSAIITSNSYSGGFWGGYVTQVFIYNKSTDPKPVFSERIYIGKNAHSGLYEVKSTLVSGKTSEWTEGSEYVLIVSSSHQNQAALTTIFRSVQVGDIVVFDGIIDQASDTAPVKVKFYNAEPENKQMTITLSNGSELLSGYKYGYHFLGWKDAQGNEYKTTEDIKGDVTLIAQYEAATLVDKIEIVNKVSEMDRFTTHQLQWTISPADAFEKGVKFKSSDENVATVDDNGLITAYANGTVTITITSLSLSGVTDTVTINVVTPAHFEISYESNSYVTVGEEVKLNASYFDRAGNIQDVVWSSITPEIATVDANGNVKGVAAGKATIRVSVKDHPESYQEMIVTVLSADVSAALQFVLDSHVSNVFTRYNLGIGAGTPVYYTDILGSVSSMLYGDELVRDTKYFDRGNQTTATFGTMKSIEFVTVHYTGNMSSGADAEANASYFVSTSDVSIHYATGNDGVFYCLDESKAAWHAGDSGSMSVVGEFKWMDTGVAYTEGEDLLRVEVTASDDGYYEIFGQKTTIKVPSPWNYSNRGTDHVLNADGTYSSNANYQGGSFKNRTIESFFNDMGLPVKVEDGKYYMGTTWWCYTQVYEGRICSTGGNYNSIGIESCVDMGSDLWYTWQKTAQLVADIMIRNNLDITRVHGHHFYSGKDCPQPMLENDCEIWWEFIGLVQTEHQKETEFKDYEFTMKSNSEYVDDHGRVKSQPLTSQVVTYTVTIKNGDKVETIELASVIEGQYCK